MPEISPLAPPAPPVANSVDCTAAKAALKIRKDNVFDAFEEAKTTIVHLIAKVITKRDTYTDHNTDCYKYFAYWVTKATNRRDKILALYNLYHDPIEDPAWACTTSDVDWPINANSYQAKVEAMESCLKQMGTLTSQIQRTLFAEASEFQCPGQEPEFRDVTSDVLQARCSLMQIELNTKLLALNDGFIANTPIDARYILLLETRDSFTKGSSCWNYYDDWFVALVSTHEAYLIGYRALLAKIINKTYDCLFDDMVFITHEANLKIIADMNVLLDAFKLAAIAAVSGTIFISRNQCKQKPTP